MRRSLAWLVAVPLMLAGSEAAHALAYRFAYPELHVRMHVLLVTGHGYLRWLPLVLGIAAAVVALSLLVTAVDAARGRAPRGLPAWAFALLPPLAFVVQEHRRAAAAHRRLPVARVRRRRRSCRGSRSSFRSRCSPTSLARLLLRTAERAGRAVARVAPPRPRLAAIVLAAPAAEPLLPRLAPISTRAREARAASPRDRLSRPPPAAGVHVDRRREMTLRSRIRVLALACAAALVVAATASAHARMSPSVSLANELQLYSLAVPTEKENLTTTKIVLTVPQGFSIDSFAPSPGWTRELQQTGSGDSAVIQKVTWTGGNMPTEEDSLFQFLAQPSKAGTYTFDVQQTYSDGSIVDWSGSESSAAPAPTIKVVELRRRRDLDAGDRRDRARCDRARRRRIALVSRGGRSLT